MRFPAWLVLIAGMLACSTGLARDPPASARRQIQTQLNAMLSAANAHDTDAFMAPLVHESSLLFIFNGEIFRGWNALHEQQLKWWQHGKAKASYKGNGPDAFLTLGPDSVVTTTSYISSRPLADGTTSTGTFVVTYVWKHLPIGWRIVYGHESWAR